MIPVFAVRVRILRLSSLAMFGSTAGLAWMDDKTVSFRSSIQIYPSIQPNGEVSYQMSRHRKQHKRSESYHRIQIDWLATCRPGRVPGVVGLCRSCSEVSGLIGLNVGTS